MTTALQAVNKQLLPGGDLTAYVRTVSSFDMLTAEREKELAEDLYYHENLDAARELVLAHLRFVVHIAKSYRGYGLPLADLIQEGNVGLMKAVKRFNPEKNVRLVSFAVHWIKAEMHEYILRNWRIVKVATTKAQRKLFFNLRSAKKRLAWFTHEEAKSVAEDLGVDLKEVQRMEGRLTAVDMGFDAGSDDDDDSAMVAPAYFLEDHSQNPEQQLEEQNWQETSQNNLLNALQLLDERSRDIVAARWLDDEHKATLHELAEKYGVSAERIRQLENNAIKKLKASMVA